MHKYSTDYLIGGAVIAAIVTSALVVVFSLIAIQSGVLAHNVAKFAAAILVSGCLMFIRPLLLKTVLSSRRNPFVLNEDLNAMISGRAAGMICGLMIGITVTVQLS
jgi:hypothetical protein